MAVSPLNYVMIFLALITVIPGAALLWRVYDAADRTVIQNPLQRLAQYEATGFIFFFVINAVILFHAKADKATSVLRVLSTGVLLYITCLAYHTSFATLNALRIVDISSTKTYYLPITFNAIDTVNQRKLFGGLILGYFSLFFGLLSSVSSELKLGQASKFSLGFWFLALILGVPGVVVCWTNDSSPTYNGSANYVPYINLFYITTITIVEWFLLTLGLINAAEDLLSGSAFYFGVAGLFFPVNYFLMQYYQPSDADFIWAGPILCWIATFCMAVSAVTAQTAKKEATV